MEGRMVPSLHGSSLAFIDAKSFTPSFPSLEIIQKILTISALLGYFRFIKITEMRIQSSSYDQRIANSENSPFIERYWTPGKFL